MKVLVVLLGWVVRQILGWPSTSTSISTRVGSPSMPAQIHSVYRKWEIELVVFQHKLKLTFWTPKLPFHEGSEKATFCTFVFRKIGRLPWGFHKKGGEPRPLLKPGVLCFCSLLGLAPLALLAPLTVAIFLLSIYLTPSFSYIGLLRSLRSLRLLWRCHRTNPRAPNLNQTEVPPNHTSPYLT